MSIFVQLNFKIVLSNWIVTLEKNEYLINWVQITMTKRKGRNVICDFISAFFMTAKPESKWVQVLYIWEIRYQFTW